MRHPEQVFEKSMRRLITPTLLFASLLLLASCQRKTATPLPAPSKPVAERAGSRDPASAADEAALREAAIKGDSGTVNEGRESFESGV